MPLQGPPHRHGGRRTAFAALVVLALLGGALLVFALSSQVGAPPQPALRSAGTASDGADAPPSQDEGAGTTDSAAEAGPAEQDHPAEQPATTAPAEPVAAASPVPLPASEPTGLRIEAIGVQERVVPIGLGDDGQLLAPRGEQADLAAWFDGSPTPGESGPAIIEGHVTWGGDPSVFFDLGALHSGDLIEVDRADGTVATFEVYDAARYPKDAFPTVAVYGRTDGPELRVITCSGDLDADGHHLDNTVVSARLVEG